MRAWKAVAATIWLIVAGTALVACGAEVSPSQASPFTPVTIDDGGSCRTDDSAVARSDAFTEPVTLTSNGDGNLAGSATVADVPAGTYTVHVECASGQTSTADLQVDAMPKAPDTGIAPGGLHALQWAGGVIFAVGLGALGFAVRHWRRDVPNR